VRNFLYRLIAVLLGFSVAFGLAEISVRIISPQETGPPSFAFNQVLGEIPVPHQKGRRRHPGAYDFTYSNNSQGFRCSREFGPKTPGALRVLLLGDSFTYGLGVNDDQTFACHLEQHLRARHPAVEVINAGCPGKGTDYELKLFQTVAAKLQPEVTVLCFFANDFQDNARGEYYDLTADGGLRVKALDGTRGGIKTFLFNFPGYTWLISWSQAANLVKQAAVNYLVRKQTGPGAAMTSGLVVSYTNFDNGFADDANRKLTAIYVDHLRQAVRRAGSAWAVFYIPVAAEVEAYRRRPEASRDEQAIKAIVETRGGALNSLTPVLAAAPEPIGQLFYVEGHWTPRAHALAGGYMGSYLATLLQGKLRGKGAAPRPLEKD